MAVIQVLRIRLSKDQLRALQRGLTISEVLPNGELLEISAEVEG